MHKNTLLKLARGDEKRSREGEKTEKEQVGYIQGERAER